MITGLILAGVYLVLLVITLITRTHRNPAEGWLMAFCSISALLMGLHAGIISDEFLLPTGISTDFVIYVGLGLSTGLIALMTLAYLDTNRTILTGVAIFFIVWIGAIATLSIFTVQPIQGTLSWLTELRIGGGLNAEVAIIGWFISLLVFIIVTWQSFLTEPLPLYANRILFWMIIIPFLFLGDLFTAWLVLPWNYFGYGLRLIGTVGAVYAIVQSRMVDLRAAVRWAISRGVLTLVSAALILTGILSVDRMSIPGLDPRYETWVIAITAALLVAVLIPLLTLVFRLLMRNLIRRGVSEPTEVVRRYGQRVNAVLDLNELANVAVETIRQLLGVQHGQMLLGTTTNEVVLLEHIGTLADNNNLPAELAVDSTIIQHLINTHRPLLQYDVDYERRFAEVPQEERRILSQFNADIYVPIVSDKELAGLLALGPKTNDDPFDSGEIELLEALASQTVTALKNARLVANLRILNEQMTDLNENLLATNDRLERLDAVKSDFLVIASHELRTPLTQIQGYADLIKELASRQMLLPDEAEEISGKLTIATRRMTEVITAMLDATQIDVDTMAMNFVETRLTNVIRLATEPFAEAIEERGQKLTARGLGDLPAIEADYPRLVQAFQNLISNAIKYTPDDGEITIRGRVEHTNEDGTPYSVRVSIEDTGIGIDDEHRDLIFEKFYRIGSVALHSTGTTKFKGAGPGLGLPIAKGIILAHKGHIWVESKGHSEEEFPGSIFHVVLPIKQTDNTLADEPTIAFDL